MRRDPGRPWGSSRLGLAAAIAVIVVLCISGVALAQPFRTRAHSQAGRSGLRLAKSYKATAPIQKGKGIYCETSYPDLPVLGTVKFKRTGNRVNVKTVLTAGSPDTEYAVELENVLPAPERCPYFQIGTIKTNAKGKGKDTAIVEVSADETEFEVFVVNSKTGEESSTPPVSLP